MRTLRQPVKNIPLLQMRAYLCQQRDETHIVIRGQVHCKTYWRCVHDVDSLDEITTAITLADRHPISFSRFMEQLRAI